MPPTEQSLPSGSRALTVGHSNHSVEKFLRLLALHSVQVLADVRSSPYSKYVTQFDGESLVPALRTAGFQYVYLGSELGGLPRGDHYYDVAGHVLYDGEPFDGICYKLVAAVVVITPAIAGSTRQPVVVTSIQERSPEHGGLSTSRNHYLGP